MDIQEDGVTVVAAATALNFVEPDATIITASGSVANVAMTAYLLLAGRPGAGNDALFSTTQNGMIVGSSAAGFGLNLNAHTGTTLHPDEDIRFNSTITTIGPITTSAAHVFDMSQSLTFDTAANPSAIVYFNLASQDTTQWDITGANGLIGFFGMLVQPNINGEVGQTGQKLCGFSNLLDFEPIITANATGQTVGDFGGLYLGKTDIGLVAAAGCDLTAGDTLGNGGIGQLTHTVHAGGDGNITIENNYAWTHYGVRSTGGAGTVVVHNDAAVWIPVGDGSPGSVADTVMATMFSEDGNRSLRHLGPGIFGDSAAPYASAVLDLVSVPGTPRALVLPRMSLVDETALASPIEGMVIANTTTNKMRYYNGTSWVDAT
jgi:hypothetical protein